MKIIDFIKILLPGLFPLLIFIVADAIWGTKIGLYVAMAVGIVQLVAIYIKEKRLDRFVLFDTLLILLMGVVSIILENDIFFKLKPGIIEGILVVILGISAFSSKNLMLMMSQRYLGGISFDEPTQKLLRRNVAILFWVFLSHTLLIFYSSFFMSKEAWAFISGGLFYLIFVVYLAVGAVKGLVVRRRQRGVERLPEIDSEGHIIGTMTRPEAHDGTKRLHPVVHAHIVNHNMDIMLQKRSSTKLVQPNKWDTAVGGHVAVNESIETTLNRETHEELGLQNVEYQYVTKYLWESDIEKELVFVFVAQHDEFDFIPNDEVTDVKFWHKNDIRNSMGKGIFTPNFEIEFKNIVSKIRLRRNNAPTPENR